MNNQYFQLLNGDVLVTDSSEITPADIEWMHYSNKFNIESLLLSLGEYWHGDFKLITPVKLEI